MTVKPNRIHILIKTFVVEKRIIMFKQMSRSFVFTRYAIGIITKIMIYFYSIKKQKK